MGAFRYQAVETSGNAVTGVIEAEDRKTALQLLSTKGIFASQIEACANGASNGAAVATAKQTFQLGGRIRRKEITAFTRQLSALLSAGIPIPQALEGLGDEEENGALKAMILDLSKSVRKGSSLSAAMEEHPRVFTKLFVSMVRVGEEAGALPLVMNDLADLLEHEEEIRGEVQAAVAYPAFVLGFGIFTVAILLTVVLPRLFGMLKEMTKVLPLPTLILLRVSAWLHSYWWLALMIIAGASAFVYW
jgi:type II secretory pathway component PulF